MALTPMQFKSVRGHSTYTAKPVATQDTPDHEPMVWAWQVFGNDGSRALVTTQDIDDFVDDLNAHGISLA